MKAGGKDWKIPYKVNGVDDYSFSSPDQWSQVEDSWADVGDDGNLKTGLMICNRGTAVKAGEDGHLGGRCVVFSDPKNLDSTGEYFDSSTEFDAEVGLKGPIYLHHTLPIKTGEGVKRISMKIGEATITGIDSEGIEIDGVLYEEMAKSHDKFIQKLIKTVKKAVKDGKLGWSTGTAAHLVVREMKSGASHIKKWPLGLDFSVTPTAAGTMQGVAVAMKTELIPEFNLENSDSEPEAGTEGAVSTVSAVKSEDLITIISQIKIEGKPMDPKDIQAIASAVKASLVADAQAQADAEKKKKEDAEAFKTQLAETLKDLGVPMKAVSPKHAANAGGFKEGSAGSNINTKYPRGDDAFKAFNAFIKHNDVFAIRTGEAYEDWERQRGVEVKTDYPLLEGTQYQGQEAVPTEVAKKIIEKRDPISLVRRAGADVMTASSNAMVVPIEKISPGKVSPVTVDGSTNFGEEQEQPMDKVSGVIYLFPLRQPIDLQLIDDATFDVEAWWSRRTARRMAITENYWFLIGNGTGQPQGLVNGASAGITGASASVFSFADVNSLYHSLKSEYRDNVAWFMTGTTEGLIRGLTGNPAYFVGNGGTQGGVGNTGYPQGAGGLIAPNAGVFNSPDMDAIGTSKVPVIVANCAAGYTILDRKLLTVIRDPYTLSGAGMLQITTFWRNSGYVTNSDAVKKLTTPSA